MFFIIRVVHICRDRYRIPGDTKSSADDAKDGAKKKPTQGSHNRKNGKEYGDDAQNRRELWIDKRENPQNQHQPPE